MEYSLSSIFASLPRTIRGMPLVLGGDPKGNNILYCNGNSVIIRNVENPSICDVYTEHSTLTTVAKYSPSGFYIASGDQSGKIRIWDTTQKEHILKKEFQPISGAIRDIAWSSDNQRIAVVGEGRERFGHVFLFETGTSNGNLSGQSKTMNSIDFRPERPFRLVSASEDTTVAMFEGPPFKFKSFFQQHTQFAHCVRYQPGGQVFASCGADGRIFLFDGLEGNVVGELSDPSTKNAAAHSGGVYAISWSQDGRQLLSASGDKTCKIWDVEARSLLTTFAMGAAIENQQLSCLWQGSHLLAVGLNGFITYLDSNNPSRPIRVVKGHNKPITTMAVAQQTSTLFTGDMEGHVTRWAAESGENERAEPKIHKSQVQCIRLAGDSLLSVGMDDTLAKTGAVFQENLGRSKVDMAKLNSQPTGLGISGDGELAVVTCQKELVVFKGGRQVASLALKFQPTCADVHPNKHLVAVGGEDNKVHIYELDSGCGLVEKKELSHIGILTQVVWSPDGTVLATADASRRVVPYRTESFTSAADKEWSFHTAKVNCVAWCPDGRHLASGSLDTNVIVWDLLRSGEHPIIIKGAHAMSQITGVGWLSPNVVISVGQDCNIKQWTINI